MENTLSREKIEQVRRLVELHAELSSAMTHYISDGALKNGIDVDFVDSIEERLIGIVTIKLGALRKNVQETL